MSLVQETDYGTPLSRATEEVRLTIDGHAVAVPAGTVTWLPSMVSLTVSADLLTGVP